MSIYIIIYSMESNTIVSPLLPHIYKAILSGMKKWLYKRDGLSWGEQFNSTVKPALVITCIKQ
jgi:hypothetical protein